jgi:hypothetical protein
VRTNCTATKAPLWCGVTATKSGIKTENDIERMGQLLNMHMEQKSGMSMTNCTALVDLPLNDQIG